MLLKIPVPRGADKWKTAAFGGLDRRPGASGGAVCAMTNLTGDRAPLLATRPPRRALAPLDKPNGLFALDGSLATVDGTALRIGGETVGAVADSPKRFAALGHRLLIWPDKLLWDGAALVPLEARFTASGLVFHDGTFAGEAAKANSVTTAGSEPFPFRAGDAVTITGCAVEPANNKTPVVREISEDGKTLRFYENTFTIPEGQTSVTETGSVTLARTVPDLDFLCVNENRVWGCRGDAIFCSKLGDPFNWNVFDGISTDAWSVESGTAGAFTACCAFLGYPVFFKEDRVFKVYGSRPSNYELMGAATLGVLPGAADTLAVAGETLFYLSRAGFVGYTGGFPAPVGAALGETRYVGGAAGSDGARYFVSATRFDNIRELLVYDPRSRLWHREDALAAARMAWADGLWALGTDGALARLGPAGDPAAGTGEGSFTAEAVFAPFDAGTFEGKYPVRLRLRGTGAALEAAISRDGGDWQTVGTLSAPDGAAASLAFPIGRCDRFSLRLRGPAPWTLSALQLELVPGRGGR